ncbi:hypothetical protein CEXT_48641 [Caerostris extrusa]|uniref:Uncharacterized protein n=1 Tax=Caerostris extrusa TaxID=172846 RepID=A0AAV4N3I7_CAEEX|nr:hypothetical protein CEXT_48641 [Caerostris extrusa]
MAGAKQSASHRSVLGKAGHCLPVVHHRASGRQYLLCTSDTFQSACHGMTAPQSMLSPKTVDSGWDSSARKARFPHTQEWHLQLQGHLKKAGKRQGTNSTNLSTSPPTEPPLGKEEASNLWIALCFFFFISRNPNHHLALGVPTRGCFPLSLCCSKRGRCTSSFCGSFVVHPLRQCLTTFDPLVPCDAPEFWISSNKAFWLEETNRSN